MDSFYEKYITIENDYYGQLQPVKPAHGNLKPQSLNNALDWLCEGTSSVLDFGCGSGGLLFCCAFRGADVLYGIDLAKNGIKYANACAAHFQDKKFCLVHGSTEKLSDLPDHYFDSLILSNILDNLRPVDARFAMNECVRALKPGGRALIKLNAYLSAEKIREWKVKVLDGDLLDDGMLLWNQSDDIWLRRLRKHFVDVRQEDVFYEEFDKHDRLFLCVK